MKIIRLLPLAALAFTLGSGCSTGRFTAAYALDPKPPRASFDDLKPAANPQPVSLVFDMHRGQESFPEGTRKFGPKVARVIEDSKLFSSVAKVGSENIARLQIALTDMATITTSDAKNLPPGLTSTMPGAEAAVLYMFTGSYQPPGQAAVKKTSHHAIHVLNSKKGWRLYDLPMTAGQAADAMLEQLTLNFLKELQREGKL